jgi:hypothetical protein
MHLSSCDVGIPPEPASILTILQQAVKLLQINTTFSELVTPAVMLQSKIYNYCTLSYEWTDGGVDSPIMPTVWYFQIMSKYMYILATTG